MGTGSTLLLGAIAGVTILLGMPLGRLRRPAPNLRLVLNAVAIGVLLFLVWDVLVHAFEPIDTALGNLHDGKAGLGPVAGYGLLFAIGLVVGLMSLVYYEQFMNRSRDAGRRAALAMGAGLGRSDGDLRLSGGDLRLSGGDLRLSGGDPEGSGGDPEGSGGDLRVLDNGPAEWSPARRLAAMIAVGIGLHNFAEGLAIGGSAARGQIGLATVLVVGFA
jgi:ZIP family zinc transporter